MTVLHFINHKCDALRHEFSLSLVYLGIILEWSSGKKRKVVDKLWCRRINYTNSILYSHNFSLTTMNVSFRNAKWLVSSGPHAFKTVPARFELTAQNEFDVLFCLWILFHRHYCWTSNASMLTTRFFLALTTLLCSS